MEDKEGFTSCLGVNRDGVSEIFGGPPRTVTTSQFSGPTVAATDAAAAAAAATVTTITAPTQLVGTVSPVSGAAATELKKKRGRPRKYNTDGTVATALSPMPISSSIPLAGEYSGWKRGRGRARSADTNKKSFRIDFESAPAPTVPAAGNRISYFAGANFTPYVLTVNPGEDVTMKIMSFAQQGSRAICILSANGTVSNVTLRQPTSSGGTLTYEGRFEILSLSGSFTPTENGGNRGRSGGMSVSLAGPDGRVVGGGLAGLLIAAGSIQVVVGSFLPGQQLESKPKKPRTELPPVVTPAIVSSIPGDEMRASYGMVRPPVITHPASFRGDKNSAPANPFPDSRNFSADNKSSSLEDDDSGGNSLSPCEEEEDVSR